MYCRWSSPAGWPSRSSTGWRVPMNEATLDKRLIAESFSRAAPTYDKAAALQRTVGSNLLGRLPRDFVPGDILDLGCGTGHFTRALAACFDTPVIGLDLAEGMLRHANEHSPGLDHWITADAERLPLRSESRDLIFSSLHAMVSPTGSGAGRSLAGAAAGRLSGLQYPAGGQSGRAAPVMEGRGQSGAREQFHVAHRADHTARRRRFR